MLEDYVRCNFPEAKCESLKPKYPESYSSFKVMIDNENFDKAFNGELWPKGTLVKRFCRGILYERFGIRLDFSNSLDVDILFCMPGSIRKLVKNAWNIRDMTKQNDTQIMNRARTRPVRGCWGTETESEGGMDLI
ncbi:hypothetical protein C0J52_24589 [Blattella germanica]|nr:hypothetical protein C0J52_24589 [Blattella germanica]